MNLKKLLPWVIVIILAYTYIPEFFGLFSAQPIQTSANKPIMVDTVKEPIQPRSSTPWPYLGDEQKQVALADDLLRKNYYVVFDGSGSMSETACSGKMNKISAAKKALIAFSGNVPRDANLGMLAFDNNGISERTPLGIHNREQFIDQVNRVYANRSTPLHSSITKAFNSITRQARTQLGYGEYHLVIVTDGFADPDEKPRSIVEKILADTPVIIHTIGFCISDKHSLNQPGRILYQSATDVQSLQRGLDDVLAESPDFTAQQF